MAGSKEEYNEQIEEFYRKQKVSALVALKISTEKADAICKELSEEENIIDVYLVTGDVDVLIKVSSETPEALSDFIVKRVAKVPGVNHTNTMLILTTFKRSGRSVVKNVQ